MASCLNCKYELNGDERFCPGCGAKCGAVCKVCGAPVAARARFCGTCGAEHTERAGNLYLDTILQSAKETILKAERASISVIQRNMGIGYNDAARIIKLLEEEGFLSPMNEEGLREILVSIHQNNNNVAGISCTMPFEWKMENGMVDLDSIESPDVRAALEKVRKLASAKEYDEAVAALPKMEFEFNTENLDLDPSSYLSEGADVAFPLDPNNPHHSIEVDLHDGNLVITVTVVFDLPVKLGIDPTEANEWLMENGGYAAGYASGGWGYSGDEGGHLLCIG